MPKPDSVRIRDPRYPPVDVVAALGGFREEDGYWEGEDYVVTFSVGHIVELLPPEEVDEKYKRWVLEVLPILPEEFKLRQKQGQSERIRCIKKLLKRDDVLQVEQVVTDKGRTLRRIMDSHLADTRGAWELSADGTYHRVQPEGAPRCSQEELMEYSEKRHKEATRLRKRRPQGIAKRGSVRVS